MASRTRSRRRGLGYDAGVSRTASMIDHSLRGCRRARKTGRHCHRKVTGSRNQVERVWQLVGPFGEPAVEIAHLVADVDDDRVTLLLKLLPLWRLEIGGRVRREVVRLADHSGPLESCGSKIRFGRRA